MNDRNQTELRTRLTMHLKGGEAYAPISTVLEQLPYSKTGISPHGLPYTFYQLMYHIRFAQLDILEYCRNPNYTTPAWPDDYWPEEKAAANEQEWDALLDSYFEERDAFCALIMDASNDLFKPFSDNPEHNLIRQAQLVIEHSSYHTGQLFVLYRLLNQ